MPSLRAIMLGLGLVLALLLQLVSATPIPTPTEELADRGEDCFPKKPTTSAPAMPLSGDATELPTTNSTLIAVALGRGIQNYSCTAVGATPSSIGAVATLFDATSLAYAAENMLNTIPPMAVYLPLPTSSLMLASGMLPVLGHHYFDAALTPTFNLTSLNKVLFAAKNGDIKAPANANAGPAKTGAVDWLYLKAKPAPYQSVGLTEVYRIVTAGGAAPTTCTKAGVLTVQYAAEYWFYQA